MKKSISILFFVSALLIACNNEKKETEADQQNNEPQTISQSKVNPEILLSSDELELAIPDSIDGFKSYPCMSGSFSDSLYFWKTSKCDYKKDDGTRLSIAIFDHGPQGHIPEIDLIANPPTKAGWVTNKLSAKETIGYSMVEEDGENGKIFAVTADRFSIRININNRIDNSLPMAYYLELIDFEYLMNKINNN